MNNSLLNMLLLMLIPILFATLPGCGGTKVTPRPISSENYQDTSYRGQVSVPVQQQLDRRYPPGFYQQSAGKIPLAGKKRITVRLFSSHPSQPDLEQSYSEIFSSAFTRSGSFTVVEREQLDQLISEIELNQSGLIDQFDSPEAGNMTAAQIVITGDIIQVGNENRLEARAIDLESGRVLLSERSNPAAFTIQAAETLARRMVRKLEQLVYD